MQWFIDIIKEWVLSLGYATEDYVTDATGQTRIWVEAKGYTTLAEVLEQLCTSTCRVHRNGNQLIPSGTWTKINFNAENWDVNNEFTNYKFTAKEAGYFQVNLAALGTDIVAGKRFDVAIYKNGNPHSITREIVPTLEYHGSYISDMVHLNGTTDYIEGYVYHNSGVAKNVYPGSGFTFMSIHQLSKDSWL